MGHAERRVVVKGEAKVHRTLVVKGELWEDAYLDGNTYDMIGDTALCSLISDFVKCDWSQGYASYGKVKITYEFYEAEAR